MKIIAPSVELMRTGMETDFCTPEQFIEKVGRTCYKSEDKITDTSAAKFVGGLISRGHEAMIEHWNIVFKTDKDTYDKFNIDYKDLIQYVDISTMTILRPYIRFTYDKQYIISGNMRAWRDYLYAYAESCEGEIPEYCFSVIKDYPIFFPEYQEYIPETYTTSLTPIDISELTYNERLVHQNVTMKFICDRGVSHEIVRHRVASFAQESTRYCNYGQEKFGEEITVIRPSWCAKYSDIYKVWRDSMYQAEGAYFLMLAEGASPQEARSVLPNSLKTEVIVTMNVNDWKHFFELRCAQGAHPDMREVATMAHLLFSEYVWQ